MNETKTEEQANKHQRERKQYFQGFKKWCKEYLGAAWEDAKKDAHHSRFWIEFIGIAVLSVYTFFNALMWVETRKNAEWTTNQAREVFNDHRPWIWVKMPDSIQIEVGKPINPGIQVFNYGKAPGIARARIRFEAGSGIIEKFRNVLRYHSQDFLVPEQDGTLKVLIHTDSGRSFPIETPQLVLSKQDLEKLSAGTIDVAVYGRIFYTDLDNAAFGKIGDSYQSSFCYYIMRDGSTTSACTNQEHKFTNWAE